MARESGCNLRTQYENAGHNCEWNDEPHLDDKGHVHFDTNRCGGMLGGISNGDDIVIRCAVKPTPTISKAQKSINMETMEEDVLEAITRRDISLLPRIYPVAEAMVRMAILDALVVAAESAHELGPSQFEPNEVVGMVRHAHAIDLRVTHAEGGGVPAADDRFRHFVPAPPSRPGAEPSAE